MATALLDLLAALEIPEFLLLGHSMGGMIAQQMAADRPAAVRRLILYGTGPLGAMPDRFEPLAVSRDRLCSDGLTPTIERIGATWFKAGRTAPGYPMLVEIGGQASPHAARAALNAMATWDGREALARLTMPTLVIWGDSDKSYSWPQVQTLWTDIPDVDLAVVPGAAHAVHLEKPVLFDALVADFLQGG